MSVVEFFTKLLRLLPKATITQAACGAAVFLLLARAAAGKITCIARLRAKRLRAKGPSTAAEHAGSKRLPQPVADLEPTSDAIVPASNASNSRVILVGAGPGDPRLVTLAALQALEQADLVLVDQIVPPALLKHVKCDIKVAPSKKGNQATSGQAQLNQWGLEALRAGKVVVRLKAGDPFVFGRSTEEALFYQEHGFEVEVVPGISSALYAPLAAGIPITSRDVAQQVLMMTGQLEDGQESLMAPYVPGQTLVLLMGVKRLKTLANDLLHQGYPPDCPVCVIENASTPDQRVSQCSVESIGHLKGIRPPAVIVIGQVINHKVNRGITGALPALISLPDACAGEESASHPFLTQDQHEAAATGQLVHLMSSGEINSPRSDQQTNGDRPVARSSVALEQAVASGQQIVEQVAFGLSDIIFVYPLAMELEYLGSAATKWAIQGRLNALGGGVEVVTLQAQDWTAGSLKGAVQEGVNACVLASSHALPSMSHNLYEVTQAKRSCVIHIAVQEVKENAAVVPDHSGLMAVPEGVLVVASQTPQQCHDLALLSHFASKWLQRPVLHWFDGIWTANLTRTLKTVPFESLNDLDTTMRKKAASNKAASNESANTLDRLMEELAPVLGHRYHLFEYVGAPDASMVLVAMGSAAAVAEQVVAQLDTEWRVGLLKVVVCRPWSVDQLLEMLPAGVERIAVLECASAQHLYKDVASSFHSVLPRPMIINSQFDSVLVPSMVKAAIDKLSGVCPERQFRLDLTPSTAEQAITEPCDVSRTVVWQTDSTLGHTLVSLLARSGFVQCFPLTWNTYPASQNACSTHIRFGPCPISAPALVGPEKSHLVWVSQPDLLCRQFPLLDTLGQRATVVFDTCWTAEELEANIPGQLKILIAQRQAAMYIVDSARLAHDFNLPPATAQAILYVQACTTTRLNTGSWAQDAQDKLLDESAKSQLVQQAIVTAAAQTEQDTVEDFRPLLADAAAAFIRVEYDFDTYLASPAGLRPVSTAEALSLGHETKPSSEENEEPPAGYAVTALQAAATMLFKDCTVVTEHSMSGEEQVFLMQVSKHERLTPDSYHRNIFHLEIEIGASGFIYEMGDALAVFAQNMPLDTDAFLEGMGWNADVEQVWAVNKDMTFEDQQVELISTRQLFITVLDIFGRPSKEFYRLLAATATDPNQKSRLEEIASDQGDTLFLARVAETTTFADLLLEFDSAKLSIPELIEAVPRIKPRLYSISSSQKECPTQVHLLIVEEDWTTPNGEYRVGLCSKYLAAAHKDLTLTCNCKPSLMRLPEAPTAPIVMAGCGTGMAPFRAFLQERHHDKVHNGTKIGPMVLYYGARYEAKEFLYRDDLEMFESAGTLTSLRCAWSRDQEHKVYIQHKIAEDAVMLWDLLVVRKGSFYLCGQAGAMPADVEEAFISGFEQIGQISRAEAEAIMQLNKDEGRYILEVY